MTAWLKTRGCGVHHKGVARLMQTMGIETLYAQSHTSQPQPGHRVSPYWLRGVPITRVNQVLEYGHHVYPTTEWLCVCGCRARLVQSLRVVLGGVHCPG